MSTLVTFFLPEAIRSQYKTSQSHRKDGVLCKMLGLFFTLLLIYPATQADGQTLVRDNKNSLGGVKDVLGGAKLLLENDDIAAFAFTSINGKTTTSLINFNTTDSTLSGSPQITQVNQFTTAGTINVPSSVPISQAAGRIYNTDSDVVAVLNAVDEAIPPGSNVDARWELTVFDPRPPSPPAFTFFSNKVRLTTSFSPIGNVKTRVVMGNFSRDSLADPLVFYIADDDGTNTHRWGMKILSAASTANPDAKEVNLPFAEGPEITGDSTGAPIPTTIVVGDFNNDGRDEIAALLADRQTVVFYDVDPDTLAIRQENDRTIKLPKPMVQDQVALATGRFRNVPDTSTTGLLNADLVVFGQMEDSPKGYSIIPIRVTPSSTDKGGFTAATVRKEDGTFYNFGNCQGASGALALSASLIYFPQQIYQQLVLGIRTDNGSSYIEIGSFANDDLLRDFNLQSETERKYGDNVRTYLQDMWVGNFDSLQTTPDDQGIRQHNYRPQIETFEYTRFVDQTRDDGYKPHIHIFDVNVPQPLPPTPGDWLTQKTDQTDNLPASLNMVNSSFTPGPVGTDLYSPGDFQGRSLRLGIQFIVRIPYMTQPDVVLEAPPMHVDWIVPNSNAFLNPMCTSPNQTGCCDPTDTTCCVSPSVPCIANVSVAPTSANSVTPSFSTKFTFDSDVTNASSSKSTTSWGVSSAVTIKGNVSVSDGLSTGTIKQKNTTKYAHDNVVSTKYGSSMELNNSVEVLTGFADHVFASSSNVNVYYYPVLGVDCGEDASSGCGPDNQKRPLYVQFSVPSNVTRLDIDGANLDWYQPVQEPGNIFSYPWTFNQLSKAFNGTPNALTLNPPSCKSLGSSTETAATQWTTTSTNSQSSGSTNTFSDDASISYSGEVGVEGALGAGDSVRFDIGASTSLDTLTQTKTSLSKSLGVGLTVPNNSDIFGCCGYGYGQYIFGLANDKHPAPEVACTAGQDPIKDNCIEVTTPGSKQRIDITATGPLFIGYIADALGTGDAHGCANNATWWIGRYTKPDIALNHPQRWLWKDSTDKVVFQTPLPQFEIDDPFYRMRGFFISKQGDTGGPNILEATAGDQLSLTARVYNYSLVPAPDPVHVRIYGQLFCTSTGEASCSANNTLCSINSVCGDSFLIGEKVIDPIPAYESGLPGNPPNWSLASVPFDTSRFTQGVHMIFWVVAWMQNSNGTLDAEMDRHGLKANPASLTLKQVTDVSVETYSNNVGVYPGKPFQIAPDTSTLGATPSSTGVLKSVSLTVNGQTGLDQRTRVTATLKSDGAPGNVSLAFFDGDPAKSGTLVDLRQFAIKTAATEFYQQTNFTPSSCGTHTLRAVAWTEGTSDIISSAITNVTIQPQDYIKNLIGATQSAKITDAQLRTDLLTQLTTVLQNYQQGQTDAAQAALGTYQQKLAGSSIDPATAGKLTDLARVVFSCGSNGFLLTALPSYATVTAGITASYNIALTPVGGFKNAVTLTCAGLPAGAACSLPQPVILDGKSQSQLAVTITTTSRTVSSAGVTFPWSLHAGRISWMLLLLILCMVAPLCRVRRLRSAMLGFIVMLFLVTSTIGCGESSSSGDSGKNITPKGVYTVTVQGISGTITQTAILTLVVK